ncbi:hypothetical protein M3Y97_00628800 [Aphelenchoides bicaudatus]|nr:hypothetical protein M3Y97_00628800 [Aphelenchoides bicaudatus]
MFSFPLQIMFPLCLCAVIFLAVSAKPSIDLLPPLAMLNVLPDDFLKFFFSLGSSEKHLIEELFLEQTGQLLLDEKAEVFDKLHETDPKLAERLHKVIDDISNKKEFLTPRAQELFDLLLVKPNVVQSTPEELKKLTQLRLQKYTNLSKRDKWSMRKQFPGMASFFETLIVDKQILEFADFAS